MTDEKPWHLHVFATKGEKLPKISDNDLIDEYKNYSLLQLMRLVRELHEVGDIT